MESISKRQLKINRITVEDLRCYTALELMYKIIEQMNLMIDTDSELRDDLEELQTVVKAILDEGLTSSVIEVLEQWVESGRFEVLVNQAINRLGDIGLSVKHFGATGNGSTDDTDAINEALEFVNTIGGATLIFPKGIYRWTRMLTVYPNTHIKCLEGAEILRDHDGSYFINGISGESYEAYGAYGNITIEGGLWNGNVNRQSYGYNMLNFGKAENITIKDATFKDYSGGHVLDISGCKYVVIDNCKFIGFRPTDGREFAEAIQLAEHTALGFEAFGPYDHSPCVDVLIQNCYFGPSGTGATYGANGIGTHSATHNVYNRDIRVVNNVFEDSYYVAVRLFKYKDCIVKGNVFRKCARGVAMSNVLGNTLSSQDADGNQTYMCQSGEDYVITDNIFDGCTTNSIYCSGQSYVDSTDESVSNYAKVKNVRIANNIIRNGKGANDLSLVLMSNLDISSNVIENSKRPIRLLYSDNVTISNNVIKTAENEAMYIYESTAVFPELIGRDITHDISVQGNILTDIGYTGIFLNGALLRGQIKNNMLINVCATSTQSNNRNGITVGAGVKQWTVSDNRIYPSEGYMQYAVSITNTCSNIVSTNNIGVGNSDLGVYNNSQGGAWDKSFMDFKNRDLQNLYGLYMGDSITAADSYQKMVNNMCGLGGYDNVAVSGYTTIDMVNALKAGTVTIPTDKYHHVAFLFIGINDFRKDVPLGTLTDSTETEITTFGAGYKKLIQELYRALPDDCTIILVTPYKTAEENHYFYNANGAGFKLKDYVDLIHELGDFYSLNVIDLYSKSGINTWTFDDYLSDKLHPTWQGYQKIATLIGKIARDLI